ncbi:SRPBCC family protein [Mucilaginibacter pedocola]|uniref:SRPBCC family protein n=1 Tax=Mucilaginibacter pedocola TaxID=1792845 RepID=A0A1S9PCL4_9SPHI|nr:hypothetical protein [Mucilaginibacter pedocola]OOQ58713.1 hypothetical protein BC343_08595 [Mucilaginibacter pedocola]
MKKVLTPLFNGYLVSNLVGLLIIGLTKYLTAKTYDFLGGTYTLAEFLIVPFLMGIIAVWFWRHEPLPGSRLVSRAWYNSFIAIALSFGFLREGVICLVILSPLLWSFMLAGCYAGRYMFKRDNQTLNVSVVALLAIFFFVDVMSEHHYENMVADEMVVNAPVSTVWKNVVAYKRNTSPDKYWLFKIGMPSPVESTAEGYYLGAKRKCIFSNGYVFDEKITTYEENKNLIFDITNQPRDPEIMGHIDILRGQFLLKDNGNGTTTVTGNSWYRLYVFPAWYYGIWAKSITRNVHIRVMEHIKEISEAR